MAMDSSEQLPERFASSWNIGWSMMSKPTRVSAPKITPLKHFAVLVGDGHAASLSLAFFSTCPHYLRKSFLQLPFSYRIHTYPLGAFNVNLSPIAEGN
nr:hypothetical protein Iba_scaffold665CG0070 [Ipomoea batatas]